MHLSHYEPCRCPGHRLQEVFHHGTGKYSTGLSVIFSIIISLTCNAQSYDTLPINSSTQKVSLLKIIELKGVKKQEINGRVNNWYTLTSNTVRGHEVSKNNDKTGNYQLMNLILIGSISEALDTLGTTGQKVSYRVMMYQIKEAMPNFFNPTGANKRSGIETAILEVYIKDEKLKLEISNFMHAGNGGQFPYEEDKIPAVISRKKWMEIRLEGVNKYQKFMDDLIKSVMKSSSQGDMNF